MKILNENNLNFQSSFKELIKNRAYEISPDIEESVKSIIQEIKSNGNKALLDFTKKFDENEIKENELLVNREIIDEQARKADPIVLKSFQNAISRITEFHKKQYPENYKLEAGGIDLSSRWVPIKSAGLYIPGGTASYPSSLIMNIIPAKIAGVSRIVVTTPCKLGKFNPYIMAILKIFQIKEIYQIGGAQAIATLAYGTETIKPVDKIYGPGNVYVASAKKQVFGKVGIDLLAGPTEVVVVADKESKIDWVAADLIAQAEHDEMSQSILMTDDEEYAKGVINTIEKIQLQLPKSTIIKKSLDRFGAIIILKTLENVHEYIDLIAPEHLHLQTLKNEQIYSKVTNVGAVFMGAYSTEALGDYNAGTNHVLPTNSTARFTSGLNVLDFMKRNSCVAVNRKGFNSLSNDVKTMAEVEGLEAHKLAVQIRED